jgi:hypothetical protein
LHGGQGRSISTIEGRKQQVKLKSPFIEQVLEKDHKIKNEHIEKFEQVKVKRQKQDAYNKFVREMHSVKVSPRKNLELRTNINRLKHPVKQRKETYDNYLDELKGQHGSDLYGVNNHQSSKKRRESESPREVSNSGGAGEAKKKKIDYLPEMLEKVKK